MSKFVMTNTSVSWFMSTSGAMTAYFVRPLSSVRTSSTEPMPSPEG